MTPGRRGRGEQRRLGAGDRRLVEVDRRRLQPVRRLEHVAGAVDLRARPSPASASRCVAIVRRAGKSPPGGASCARPRRASSGPSSSTEPRSRPTSAPSGSSFDDLRTAHAQRRGADALDLGAEIEEQPRHHLDVADARHVGEHALFGRQQARREQRQRARSCCLRRRPRRTGGGRLQSASVDMSRFGFIVRVRFVRSVRFITRSRRDRRSLRAARRRSARARRRRHRSISARMSRGRRGAVVDDEVAVRRRHARAADRRALQPGPIDQRAGRPRDAVRHAVASRLRILKDAAGARRVERLRPLAKRQRRARRRAQRRRIARPTRETPPTSRTSPRVLQAAAIVAERHRRRAARRSIAPSRDASRTLGDEIADEAAAEMRVAEDRAADGARRPGPRFEPGAAVVDRPAHQAVDRHRGIGADVRRRRSARTSPPRGRITSPRTPRVRHQHVRSAAEHRHRHAGRRARAAAPRRSRRSLRVSISQSAGPPTRNVVSGASATFARTRSAPNAASQRVDEVASRAPRLERHQRAFLRDQRRHRFARRADGERDRVARAELPRDGRCRRAITVAIFG